VIRGSSGTRANTNSDGHRSAPSPQSRAVSNGLYATSGATLTYRPNVRPPSPERTAETPNCWNDALPSKSRQSTYTSPSASTATSHPWPDTLPLMPIGLENEAPPFVDRLNMIVVDGEAPTNFVQHM
jgi:hypothetical protein